MAAILVTLACNAIGSGVSTQAGPGLVNMQVAMAMTQTALNKPPLAATNDSSGAHTDPSQEKTQVALALTQTAISNPPEEPTKTATQQVQQPTAQDIQARINSSNILVYEEMVDRYDVFPYVKMALNSVGGHHKLVGDAMGSFMDEMNSGTKWDLIIMAAEERNAISGDYWTELKRQVDNKGALIAEVWYLDHVGGEQISSFLYECGVEVEADWQLPDVYNRIDYGMYWTDPNNPVFNTPNKVNRLSAILTEPYWSGDIGDFLKLRSGSSAKILASLSRGNDQSRGLITSCFDGRAIIQTFSSHDYPTNDMVALWQNYIITTLTNHFLATQ